MQYSGQAPDAVCTRLLMRFMDVNCFENDIIRAHFHITVHPEHIEKTAVCTPFGFFEFPFLNFGFCGATQTS